MKQRITIFLLCLPLLIFAQKNKSIDFVAGIDYNYRSLNSNSSDDGAAKIGYRFGFNYNKQLTDKLYFKLGLRGVNIRYETEKILEFVYGSEIEAGLAIGTGPIFDPTLPHEFQFFYDYWFLEVPIVGRYEFSESRWSPFVEVGLSPNLYLRGKEIQQTDLGETNFEAGNINKMQLVGSVSFGVNYAATENLQVFAQPIFRYHLTKTTDLGSEEHLYNAGLEIGMRKRLK